MQRVIDVTLSVLASAFGFALSWPFWRDFEYWAESQTLWYVYFVVGFVLAVYLFYVFIGSLRTLFDHDALLRESSESIDTSCDKGDRS